MKSMGRRIVALAVASALLVAGTAAAGTKKDVGAVWGDSGSRVVAKVTVKHGKPKAIRRLKLQFDSRCLGDNFKYSFPDPIKVKKYRSGFKFSKTAKAPHGAYITAKGKVKKHGAKMSGTYSIAGQSTGCIDGGHFSAKQR